MAVSRIWRVARFSLLNAQDDARKHRRCRSRNGMRFALEDALAHLGLCGAVARSEAEWRDSPQGRALADTPPIVLTRIGDAPRLELPADGDPLAGMRVLDLTRVLAGPAAGRTLACHGADVLGGARRTAADGRCLRSRYRAGQALGFSRSGQARRCRSACARLAREAHVFVDSYRPGALARLGFSPEALAHLSPGIVHVAASIATATRGPWAHRRGWEQLAQTATGIALEQGAFAVARAGRKGDGRPRLIPAAACDYITGYLAAAGAAAALLAAHARRRKLGGRGLAVGHRDVAAIAGPRACGRGAGKLESRLPDSTPPCSRAKRAAAGSNYLGPVMRMSETPARMAPSAAGTRCGRGTLARLNRNTDDAAQTQSFEAQSACSCARSPCCKRSSRIAGAASGRSRSRRGHGHDQFPNAHGDHFHLGDATVAGKDMTGLFNEKVWHALERKGVARADWPRSITLTKTGREYDTGLCDEILHHAAH